MLYMPLIPLLFWGGLFLMTLGMWASTAYINLSFPMMALGFGGILIAVLTFQNYDLALKWHYRLLHLPRWYHELRERTTRYERRRIAYAWIRMPWRAQLSYNSDDRAFFIWADFIIMGTTMDEEDEMFTAAHS
jgi:hypothetical protein